MSGDELGKSSAETTVLRSLSTLAQQRTVRSLFGGAIAAAGGGGTGQGLAGLCVVYAALIQLWSRESDAIRNAVAFSPPETLQAIGRLVMGDEQSMQAFESSSGQASAVPMEWLSGLVLLCEAYSRLLEVQTDEDFFGGQVFALPVLARLVQLLRLPVLALYTTEFFGSDARHRGGMVQLLSRLYERDCRKPFVASGQVSSEVVGLVSLVSVCRTCSVASHCLLWQWLAPELDSTSILRELTQLRLSRLSEAILQDVPFFLPFLRRVEILRTLVANDGGFTNDEQGILAGGVGVRVQIRRDHIMEDGFRVFHDLKAHDRLKERLRITFIDANGLEEPGVDGGGIYKEFLNQLVTTAFVPSKQPTDDAAGIDDRPLSLFLSTEGHRLYPNPLRREPMYSEWYEFLVTSLWSLLLCQGVSSTHFLQGMVLGKAIYEGQLVELPLVRQQPAYVWRSNQPRC